MTWVRGLGEIGGRMTWVRGLGEIGEKMAVTKTCFVCGGPTNYAWLANVIVNRHEVCNQCGAPHQDKIMNVYYLLLKVRAEE